MPSDASNPNPSAGVWNVPNQISAARLVLAVVCFGALSFRAYGAALALFVLASITDWLDGYWARRFNQITQLGRILDPFADKVVVCGVFIYLAAIPNSGVLPWMAVVVTGRELLVTALRGFVEQSGGDFSAKSAGKWKMIFQCAAIIGTLAVLTAGTANPWVTGSVAACLWIAILLTIYSGWAYVRLAAAMIQER